jgi:predicted O-methyltransferase YrrM
MSASLLEEERIGVRIGLESTELPENEDDPTALGLILAKRLCDAASPGQILCGPILRQLLAARTEFAFRPPLSQTLSGVGNVGTHELAYEHGQRPYDWTEQDAAQYRELAAIAVPNREEQLAHLLCLIPFSTDAHFRAVELGCGDGSLSRALLTCFANTNLVALERSDSQLATAAACLHSFGERGAVRRFDFSASEWLSELQGADCVLSSLALHHVSGGDKATVFREIFDRINQSGALLIADIVQPSRPEQWELYGSLYDLLAQSTAESLGDGALMEKFRGEGWNMFRMHGIAQEYPSPLVDQLDWLRLAGFLVVDCYWLRSGFAVYGGYKTRERKGKQFLRFETAIEAVKRSLDFASRIP